MYSVGITQFSDHNNLREFYFRLVYMSVTYYTIYSVCLGHTSRLYRMYDGGYIKFL